jgi:putative ABC transport system ATP-binding protein
MNREILRATGITKVFGRGEQAVVAVDGVDLTVEAGQIVLIMGPSGSGKTTLLTILGGLLRPTSGSVVIDGTEITALPESQLTQIRRSTVGFIFQSFNLWESLNVQENVELALNMAGVGGRRAEGRARALLLDRGLGHRLKLRARDLSGGEKQRVSVARALANEPALLLADEPTANLDSKHGLEIMHVLRDIAKGGERPDGRPSGRAVIAVSHDQRIREVADGVLCLEDGRIKDIGRLARDPVCGMSVEVESSVSIQYAGATMHFCSRGCSWEFEASPEKFVADGAASDESRAGGKS